MSTVNPMKSLAACVSPPPSRKKCEELLSLAATGFGLELGSSDAALDDRLHETFRCIRKNLCSEDFAATATLVEVALALGMQPLAEAVLSAFLAAPPEALASATIGQRLHRIADCSQDLSAATHSWWLESACRLLVSIAHLNDRSAGIDALNECFLGFLGKDSSLDTLETLSHGVHPAIFYSLVRTWHQIRIAAGHDPYDPLYDSGLHVVQKGKYADVSPRGESWYTSPYPNLRTAFVASLMESSLSDGVILIRHTNLPFRKIPPGPCQFFAARMLLQMHANECDSQIAEEYRQGILQRLIFDCLDEHLRPDQTPEFYAPAVKATALVLRFMHELISDGKESALLASMQLVGMLMSDDQKAISTHLLVTREFAEPYSNALLQGLLMCCIRRPQSNVIEAYHSTVGTFLGDPALLTRPQSQIEVHVNNQLQSSDLPVTLNAVCHLAGILASSKFRGRNEFRHDEDRSIAIRLLHSAVATAGQVLDEGHVLIQNCRQLLLRLEVSAVDSESLYDRYRKHLYSLPEVEGWASAWWQALCSLRHDGHVEVARRLINERFIDTTFVHSGRLGGRDMRIDLASEIVHLVASTRPEFVEELARAIAVEQDEHYDSNTSEGNRDWFLTFSETGRHTVGRALSSLPNTDAQEVRRRQVAALLWDCRYTGRRLIDRRRNWSPNGQSTVSLPPTGDLSQALGPAALADAYSSSASLGCGTMLSLKDEALYRTAPQEDRASSGKSFVPQRSDHAFRSSGSDRAAKEALASVDEAYVAGLLTAGTVLLKIGFSLDGRLVWSAFQSREARLDLVGCDGGNGYESAQQELKNCVHEFDADCTSVLNRGSVLASLQALRQGDGGSPYYEFLQELDDNEAEWCAQLYESLTAQQHVVTVADGKGYKYVPLLDSNTVKTLARWFGTPSEWGSAQRPIPRRAEWETYWGTIGCRRDLNHATEEFLSRASSVIPVDEIASVLKGRDVLFMLEDSLFAIPLSFLKCKDGRRLLQIAKSIRTVLSPAVHGQLIHDESQPYAAGATDQVLCISGVPGRLPDEMVATKRLFERHSQLAASNELQNPLIWRGAWDWPRGCHDVMARGIYDAEKAGVRTALLTVLGHGHRDGGVELRSMHDAAGAEFWRAHCVQCAQAGSSNVVRGVRPACDLSSVDFLIQVSCSVGRAEQDGLYDVQGFPANLVVAGGRSTAAARWPILADEAERFANHLAGAYLRRRDEAIRDRVPFKNACIRGLALAETRKWWLESHGGSHLPSGDNSVGLHTAAAFELYGFG